MRAINSPLAGFVQFKPQIIPNHAALQIATGHGEGHVIFAGFQHRRIKLQRALLREAFVGIVTDAIGGDEPGVFRGAAIAVSVIT
jgi:hypothetical protein